jgi:hypothetical protein
VLHPGIADPFFSLGIAQSYRRSPAPVGIQNDPMMEESPSVNLTQSFFGGVVRELAELLANLIRIRAILETGLVKPCCDFALGSLVQIFQIQTRSPRLFERENHSVLHVIISIRSMR